MLLRLHTGNFIGKRCFIPIRDTDIRREYTLDPISGSANHNLTAVSQTIHSREACKEKLGDLYNNRTETCASSDDGRDPCRYSGGSGLYCTRGPNDSTLYLKGVHSWYGGCNDVELPGIYTDVRYAYRFIDETLSREKEILF